MGERGGKPSIEVGAIFNFACVCVTKIYNAASLKTPRCYRTMSVGYQNDGGFAYFAMDLDAAPTYVDGHCTAGFRIWYARYGGPGAPRAAAWSKRNLTAPTSDIT